MRIKYQFYLLIFGIVVIPVLAFLLDGIRIQHAIGISVEEFRQFRYLRELAGLPEPPAWTRFTIFFITKAVVLFSITVSMLIVRSITKSVAALEYATRRIASGELDLVVDVRGSNEITSLSNSINTMRSALREEEKRRCFFITGITHDLKTPLALIKANIEAVEDDIPASAEEKNHSLKVINSKVDEMEGMVNSLLDFIRMDSGEAVRNVRMTNLYSFLSSYAERVTIDGELLNHKIESSIILPSSLAVKMESHLVQCALDNIVTRFFRYTPNGSCLFITAALDGSSVKLNLSSNEMAVEQNNLLHSTTTKPLIESIGWSISVSPLERKGTTVTITIPYMGLANEN